VAIVDAGSVCRRLRPVWGTASVCGFRQDRPFPLPLHRPGRFVAASEDLGSHRPALGQSYGPTIRAEGSPGRGRLVWSHVRLTGPNQIRPSAHGAPGPRAPGPPSIPGPSRCGPGLPPRRSGRDPVSQAASEDGSGVRFGDVQSCAPGSRKRRRTSSLRRTIGCWTQRGGPGFPNLVPPVSAPASASILLGSLDLAPDCPDAARVNLF
jgi:hypothetical protein